MQKVKTILFYIFSLLFIFSLSTYLHLKNSAVFGNILTFLSITIGFSITALSIIASSSFSKDLYKIEVPKDNSKTLLHQLVDKFKISINIFVVTIVFILIYNYTAPLKTGCFYFWNTSISIKSVLSSFIWYFTILTIWYFLGLLKLFTKFVIQNAKRK